MVASTDIKFYVHTNTNAPQLQNAFGCMIDVLDACLVNGFGSQTVSTLSVNGTKATATYGTAHNYLQGQVVKVAGADQIEFNGEHRINVESPTSISYTITGSNVSQATGTITTSLPPLGFEKPYASTNPSGGGKAAYRTKNTALASRPFLRVVDERDPSWTSTYAKYAKVGIVENMTGIDAMSGDQMPYDPSNPTKNWVGTGTGSSAVNGWAKWHYAVSTGIRDSSGTQVETQNDSSSPIAGVRQWFVIGNDKYFYILNSVVPADNQYLIYGFGVVENPNSTDWFLASDLTANIASDTYRLYDFNNLAYQINYAVTPTILLFKANARLTTDILFLSCPKVHRSRDGLINSGISNYITNSGDANAHPLVPPTALSLDGGGVRVMGHLPGIYWLLRNRPFNEYQMFANGDSLLLAKLVMANTEFGQVVFDLGEA